VCVCVCVCLCVCMYVCLFVCVCICVYTYIYLYSHTPDKIQNYNFACCLYGCENWSLILREKLRLRVFENRVLRRLFGPKKD
jgi:hypothetical protein